MTQSVTLGLQLLLLEKLRRAKTKRAILDELTAVQRRVAMSTSRHVACLCGRRAGKTSLMARIIALIAIDAGNDEMIVYSALTKSQAKDLIWTKLTELNQRHKLGWKMRAHEGSFTTPAGATFRMIGISDRAEVEKVRGMKLRAFFIDEPAMYSKHLEQLYKEVISQALADLAGRLYCCGTPGPVPSGWWWQCSTGQLRGWDCFKWTVRENTAFERFHEVETVLQEERDQKGWSEDSAQYQIEWLGEWKLNSEQLVYAYDPNKNTAKVVPATFEYVTMGIDYGCSPDPCAWVILGSNPNSRDVYVLHSQARTGLLPDDAAVITAALIERFGVQRVVGDGGGLGKPYVEAFNRGYAHISGRHVEVADKTGLLGSIELLNGEIRSGRLLLTPDAATLAAEMVKLPWKDEKRQEPHPGYANHECDALRYCQRIHPISRPPAPRETPSEVDQLEALRQARLAAQRKRAQAPRALKMAA